MLLQVYDPEYYVAFSLPSAEAVRLVEASAGCRLSVTPAEGSDADAAAALATIGPDQRELPADIQDLTGGVDNSAAINCGGPTVAAAEAAPGAPEDAGEAVRRMAEESPGDLTALAAEAADGEAAPNPAKPAAAPPRAAIRRLRRPPRRVVGRVQPAAERSAEAAEGGRLRLLVARRPVLPLRRRARRGAGPRKGGDLHLSPRQRAAGAARRGDSFPGLPRACLQLGDSRIGNRVIHGRSA